MQLYSSSWPSSTPPRPPLHPFNNLPLFDYFFNYVFFDFSSQPPTCSPFPFSLSSIFLTFLVHSFYLSFFFPSLPVPLFFFQLSISLQFPSPSASPPAWSWIQGANYPITSPHFNIRSSSRHFMPCAPCFPASIYLSNLTFFARWLSCVRTLR